MRSVFASSDDDAQKMQEWLQSRIAVLESTPFHVLDLDSFTTPPESTFKPKTATKAFATTAYETAASQQKSFAQLCFTVKELFNTVLIPFRTRLEQQLQSADAPLENSAPTSGKMAATLETLTPSETDSAEIAKIKEKLKQQIRNYLSEVDSLRATFNEIWPVWQQANKALSQTCQAYLGDLDSAIARLQTENNITSIRQLRMQLETGKERVSTSLSDPSVRKSLHTQSPETSILFQPSRENKLYIPFEYIFKLKLAEERQNFERAYTTRWSDFTERYQQRLTSLGMVQARLEKVQQTVNARYLDSASISLLGAKITPRPIEIIREIFLRIVLENCDLIASETEIITKLKQRLGPEIIHGDEKSYEIPYLRDPAVQALLEALLEYLEPTGGVSLQEVCSTTAEP